MRDIAIVGIGLSEWGEVWKKGLRELWTEAAVAALTDAGVDRVDAVYVGCMAPGLLVGQANLGALLADTLGMGPIPGTRIEAACASGAAALRQALLAVGSGCHDIVLASGVEKMTDVGSERVQTVLATATDQDYEGYNGVTLAALYGVMARAHMERHGTTRRQLSLVTSKNHAHGALNPGAQYRMKVTPEAVERAPLVADPLTVLDCSPISDGAAACVVMPLALAKRLGLGARTLVRVAASAHCTAPFTLAERPDITALSATERAAKLAYAQAGVGPGDISLFEVHDSYSIAEIMASEALGLADAGLGGALVESGATRLGGRSPINVSGGLKSRGHPLGATGVAQVCGVVAHLRGEAGVRQVEGARRGLTQSTAGTGASALVHIFESVPREGGGVS